MGSENATAALASCKRRRNGEQLSFLRYKKRVSLSEEVRERFSLCTCNERLRALPKKDTL